MDLTQKSIQEIERLVDRASEIKTIEINGEVLARSEDALKMVSRRPTVDCLASNSLDSLCEFINRNLNASAISKTLTRKIVHVESPTRVTLYAEANAEDARMDLIAAANALTVSERGPMTVSLFISYLNTSFQPNEDRDALIEMVSNIRSASGEEVIVEDDGISSTVQYTKKSGSISGKTKFVNPAVLKPYSTFDELGEQPEREYIFRMDENFSIYLMPVESCKWKLDTMGKIKEYIKERINKSDMIEVDRPDEDGNMVKEQVENGKLVDRGAVVII